MLALEKGMGAVLRQDRHLITFYSKNLCVKLQNSSTYVRDCMLLQQFTKWRHYLLENKFIVERNEKSLKELMTQVMQTPNQHYFLTMLLGYDYDFVYRSGKDNKVPKHCHDWSNHHNFFL